MHCAARCIARDPGSEPRDERLPWPASVMSRFTAELVPCADCGQHCDRGSVLRAGRGACCPIAGRPCSPGAGQHCAGYPGRASAAAIIKAAVTGRVRPPKPTPPRSRGPAGAAHLPSLAAPLLLEPGRADSRNSRSSLAGAAVCGSGAPVGSNTVMRGTVPRPAGRRPRLSWLPPGAVTCRSPSPGSLRARRSRPRTSRRFP